MEFTKMSVICTSTTLLSRHPQVMERSLFIIKIFQEERERAGVSFFSGFPTKQKDADRLKEELFEAIKPLDRRAEATPEEQERLDQIARELEAINNVKEPLKSELLNGKWELLYTTSQSVLQTQRPKFLRPNGKIYQAINADTFRAQHLETWPFFNQAIQLNPLPSEHFTISAQQRIWGLLMLEEWLLILIFSESDTHKESREWPWPAGDYLDDELRISRGGRGNLFILKMVDPSYRVPLRLSQEAGDNRNPYASKAD